MCDQDTPRDWVARNGTNRAFGESYVWYDDNTISQIVESRTTRPYEAEIGRNNNTLALIYFRAYQALSTILTAFSATTVNPDLSTRRFKRDKITFTSYQILQLKEKKASYKRQQLQQPCSGSTPLCERRNHHQLPSPILFDPSRRVFQYRSSSSKISNFILRYSRTV